MGGRLTEFNQYDILDLSGGRPRPVDGPKGSAIPIGKHLRDNQPVIREIEQSVGYRGVDITVNWPIQNESIHNLYADYRIVLRQTQRFSNDPIWFEYSPKVLEQHLKGIWHGVTHDRIWTQTKNTARIVTHHGASKSTKRQPVAIRAGGTTTMRMGLTLPGTGGGAQVKKFWKKNEHATFNLLIAVYQVGAGDEVFSELAEHEFKNILELRVPEPSEYRAPQLTERAKERLEEAESIIQWAKR